MHIVVYKVRSVSVLTACTFDRPTLFLLDAQLFGKCSPTLWHDRHDNNVNNSEAHASGVDKDGK